MKYLVGLDLGQAQDFTAMTIIEYERRDRKNHYAIRELEQFPLRTPYTEIVKFVKARMSTEPLKLRRGVQIYLGVPGESFGNTHLVVDKTGVGAPVTDMFREAGMSPRCISIHGGDNVTQQGVNFHVPKRDLISAAQVTLETGRLKISSKLPHAQTLIEELLNYRITISQAGHDSYNAREGKHDDLVLAVAMAVWFGEKHG